MSLPRFESRSLPVLTRISRGTHVLAVLVALTVLGTTAFALWPDPPRTHVVAHFPRTIGLYEGSDVRVLGVPIGTVDRVVPAGRSVRVEFSYDAEQKVPAHARAVIVAPSIVSDRYVQLTPVYKSGPAMADGTDIPLEETAVPVELDRIYGSLDDLAVALGPEGANRDGALSRLLEVGADNLDGQGRKLHATVGDLADALGTVSGGRDDLFATVRQLQDFTSTLAANDDQVRAFNTDLQSVADQLAGERADLQRALDNLAVALTQISSFVHENRAELRQNVHGLTEISKTLVKQRDALREVLDEGPVALANLNRAYNGATGTLDTRDNFAQLDDPGLYLCSLLRETGQPQSVCDELQTVLDQLPDLPEVPGGPARSAPSTPATSATSEAPTTSDPTLGGIVGAAR